jgi:hypothetical protein
VVKEAPRKKPLRSKTDLNLRLQSADASASLNWDFKMEISAKGNSTEGNAIED